MFEKKLALIHEQSSPLFRIMNIYDHSNPMRRKFSNNISAFHVGNGIILTVAHHLRADASRFESIDQVFFEANIRPHLNASQILLFDQYYPLDPATNKRYSNIIDQKVAQSIIETLKQIKFDTRWFNLINCNICNPFLIVQFINRQFYSSLDLTASFNVDAILAEPPINRNTFLLPLELVSTNYSADIALYRIINTSEEVINRLPKIEPDFSLFDDNQANTYCLQSSPNSEVGRLLNKAHIDGLTEHFGIFSDNIGGKYIGEGLRYLIKGYFRFGSSGAPYVYFNNESETFKVWAIQSEACPIQLSINNSMQGNFQYINAIATPLHLIQNELEGFLT